MSTNDILDEDVLPEFPAIILVEPQLAENIGMVARAMANFGLNELRMVSPRGGWPKKGARSAASGATHILDNALLFDNVHEAVADLTFVFATTARERGQMKQVFAADEGMKQGRVLLEHGNRLGVLFGRERVGLTNDEVALADAIITFPVDQTFPSLNLAQSVLLIAYEWQRSACDSLPFSGEMHSPRVPRAMLQSFLNFLEKELDARGYYPADRKQVMLRNMYDIFQRREMTEQDVRTLRGIFNILTK